MSAYGKATWGTISGYNSYFSTYISGDLDIFPQISIDISGNATKVGTGDLIIRSGNLYMGLSGYINNFPVSSLNSLSSTTSASTLNYLSTLSGQVNSLQLGATNAGGINVGGLNMATYETIIGVVAPKYPDWITTPFTSNYFSLNSGNWAAGTYIITTSSSSTLPQYQAYNVFNSNSATDLCWVSASGLYLNGNYKGTTTTKVYSDITNSVSTLSGEWIQIQLPYKLILSLGSLSYYLQPRYINPAQNAPSSFTFMGSNFGDVSATWVRLDSQTNYNSWNIIPPNYFSYTVPSSAVYKYQYFRLVISKIAGTDTACGINQWYMLGIPQTVITTSYLYTYYSTKAYADSTYATIDSINSLQLGATNAGGININGINMAMYDTVNSPVSPIYPNSLFTPFTSNYFTYNSGDYKAGTYSITTSSSSTLPQYQAYNVFNSNSANDLCWVSASGLYLNGNYKGTTTTQVFNLTTSSFSTISGEWIQIQLPYKLLLNSTSLYYYIQPRFLNPAQNAPVTFTFIGAANSPYNSSGAPNVWTYLDSKTNYSWNSNYTKTMFTYTSSSTAYQYQHFRIIISQILGTDTACGINQWYMLGTPKTLITSYYLFNNYSTKAYADSTYALTSSITNYQPQLVTISSSLANYALTSSLATYALTSSIINYQPQLVTISSCLATYALTSSLANYALTSSIINYQPQLVTISSNLATYALTSTLANYALTSSIKNYQPQLVTISASLATYALTSSLANYALTSSIINYQPQLVTISSCLATYALTSTLANYALTSSITNYQPQLVTISSCLATYALTSSLANYALTSSIINYQPQLVTISASLANYALLSTVTAAGSTFSNGLTITNGSLYTPYLIGSAENYNCTFSYYSTLSYQIYNLANAASNVVLAIVNPAANFFGQITVTTPIAYVVQVKNIPSNGNSANFSINIDTSCTVKIYKNPQYTSLFQTVTTSIYNVQTIQSTYPLAGLMTNSKGIPQIGDFGQYIGTLSFTFTPDYNATGSDYYFCLPTFNLPNLSSINTYVNILFNFPFSFIPFGTYGIFNTVLSTSNADPYSQINVNLTSSPSQSYVGGASAIIAYSKPCSVYAAPTTSWNPVLITGLSGSIACKNISVADNIYLGGTTKTIAVSVAKTIVAGARLASVKLAQPLGVASTQYTLTANVSTDTTSIVTPAYMITSNTTISAAINYTFNSKYDENCYVDGFLVVNNITNLGTNIITGDLVLNSTLSGALYNSLYCYNVAQFYSQLVIYDTTQSIGTGTGALQVVGGASFFKDVFIGGNLQLNAGNLTVAFNSTVYGNHTILNTTPSTSTLTGALVCNGGVGISGDVNMSGSLTVNTNFTLVGDIIQPTGYYLSQFYTKDEQESTSVTTGSIVGKGGCGISKNITVGGNINTSVTTAPASANSLGYQTTTSTSTNQSLTTATYFNLLNFVITSANYGTYMMEFSCQIKTSTTTILPYYLVLYTSTSFTLSSSTMSYALNTITSNHATNGIILRFSRVFSCYSNMTIYAMPRVDFAGTATVMSSNLTATRIA
jgi:hypothetical protein